MLHATKGGKWDEHSKLPDIVLFLLTIYVYPEQNREKHGKGSGENIAKPDSQSTAE